MDVAKFLKEVESSYAEYYRPVSHVIPMWLEENEYSPVRYLVVNDGENDFGGFVVKMNTFPDFWYDWYLGEWSAADDDVKSMLKDQDVLRALSIKYGDIAVCPDSVEDRIAAWKKIISRCLHNDDSLIEELDVMDADNNGMDGKPAASYCKEDEWLNVPLFDNYLKTSLR